MKDSRSIISHLVKQPSFQKCEQMRCFERLLGALPSSFTQWVKFLYIKNDTLFFVFNHPCAKMEFNYKRNLIKSLLSQISAQLPNDPFLHVKTIQCFVSNQITQESAPLMRYDGNIYYTEQAFGVFENGAHEPKLHALFEAIRHEIASKKPC